MLTLKEVDTMLRIELRCQGVVMIKSGQRAMCL
jgi:hypothetical protein